MMLLGLLGLTATAGSFRPFVVLRVTSVPPSTPASETARPRRRSVGATVASSFCGASEYRVADRAAVGPASAVGMAARGHSDRNDRDSTAGVASNCLSEWQFIRTSCV